MSALINQPEKQHQLNGQLEEGWCGGDYHGTSPVRFPYDPHTHPNSHTIENVITSFEPNREKKWWQSENGLDHVSIRLDLEALFQFSHLILTFKTFRPAAMLVERSTDYGHTWKVFKYFAKDCATSFPSITSGQAQGVGDLVCDSKYSDIEPSTGGEVVFKALDPSFEIENPYSPHIQDLVTLTNLRINFTKLHTLGDTLLGRRHNDSLDKYYYALYEMVVRGSCFCNGHASECGPMQTVPGDVFSPPGMVHGRCVCQHNTGGTNCERCQDFFQDAPWRPAAGPQDNTCRACSCNGHSDRCHFDMSVYLASGGVSGGVCEDCQHNTEGQHCHRCRPLFYRDPLKAVSDPYACLPCECDPDGTISGGICESHSDLALGSVAGQCLCKENVEGAKCDQCKPNHYGLSATDPLGCQHSTNHMSMCSPKDGQCECRPHVTGRSCTEPAPGYFFASLNYYLYEAEEAMPLQGLAPLILATALPTCDVYLQPQGSYFIIDKGNIILKRNPEQSIHADQQSEGSVTFGRVPAVHVVFREPVPGMPVTWTGPGFARVLPGAGLRFSVNNIPSPMDFTVAIRYETQSAADWAVQVVVNPPGGSKHCTRKIPPQKPPSFALPATSRVVLLPTPICLEPDVQYSIDVYFSQPLEGGSHAHSHILVDSPASVTPRAQSGPAAARLEASARVRLTWPGAAVTGAQQEATVWGITAVTVACDCNREGTQKPICDRDTGMCHCREGVSGQRCDHCARGHGQEFPACLRCHSCFDQWDHAISFLSSAVQGLIRLAANMQDKRETLPVCEADFKGLGENMSEIERILKHPVFSSGEFLKVKDYHDSVRKQIMQLGEQWKTVHEFQDLEETILKMRNESDLILENLQEEIDLYSSARNASIMDFSENIKKYYHRSSSAEKRISETTSIINISEKTRIDLLTVLDTLTSKENLSLEKLKQIKIPDIQILNEKVCGERGDMPCVLSSCAGPSCHDSLTLSRNALQKAQEAESMIQNLSSQAAGLKNQIKNISKLAEVSKNNSLQLSEKLWNMKNQSESEEENMNLLIKKLKKFLLEENVPPEDIEKVANHVLDIHLPITSQNITHARDNIQKLMQLCEDYRTNEDKLNKAADRAQKILVKAKAAEKAASVLWTPDQMLNKWQQVEITEGRANSNIAQLTAEQTENKAQETENELDLAKQQSALEDGLSRLRVKLRRNQEQAIHVGAQAESAQRQAGGLQEDFVELKNQYAVLQHKTSATGLTKETLGKVKQLKDAAAKLAGDTEDKIRRIAALKTRHCNLRPPTAAPAFSVLLGLPSQHLGS
ncbi:Laminin subunit beta-4 [Myotis brandtii]|uniref:Laminin subunit beta-4 n=1 Tax=Myotis brandtii TaxID=109478 RepID=S7NZ34_MYOBR|nr:Laminin subunit beta-4 [Myotis brandtii]